MDYLVISDTSSSPTWCIVYTCNGLCEDLCIRCDTQCGSLGCGPGGRQPQHRLFD